MQFNRRLLLIGASILALALAGKDVEAWTHGSVRGWQTLKVGAGGLITGFEFADDKRMLCRCDTFGAYIWSDPTGAAATYETVSNPAQYWKPLFTLDSLRNAVSGGFDISAIPITNSSPTGAWDACFAPSNSNRLLAVTSALTTQTVALTKCGVYISDNAGATWRMVNDATNFPIFVNADPNTTYVRKSAQNKIAIDPQNQSVMYAGMPLSSGNTYAVYRSTDGGTTWDGTWCSGVITVPSAEPGVCGMLFDRNAGTVTAFGKTVSKRMMFGVSGIGAYETIDGGVNWALTSSGPTTFYMADMDFDGRYYVSNSYPTNSELWRYDPGVTAGGGTWFQISSGSGFPAGMSGFIASFCCDKRSGGQGKLWMSRGGLHGYYSANAQNATINNITWVGHSGTPVGSYNAAPNDLPWTEKTRLLQTSNVKMTCDANGVVWQCGTQDFWYATMPIYANGGSTAAVVLNAVGRGIEQTVTASVLRPPGSPNVLVGMLDVGLFKKAAISTYPSFSDWWEIGQNVATRLDCTGLEFARNNPAFVTARANVASSVNSTSPTGKFNAYSSDYGASWTKYATMPDALYSDSHAINGGYILAFDEDRHLCVTGDTQTFIPCYTANARSGGCTWTLCNDLPSLVWLGTPDSWNYKVSHTIDADHVLAGTAYAHNYSTGDIWRSTNYGVNWSVVGNKVLTGTSNRNFLYTIRGQSGGFYLTSQHSGATGHLWKYSAGGTDASPLDVPLPGGVGSVFRIALGASKPGNSNPALYLLGWNGQYTQFSLWRSDAGDGSDWVQFGGTLESSLPALTQLDAPRIFAADWVEYKKVYLGSWGSGFSVYSG